MSDDQYRLLEPLIPPAKFGGRPRATDMRRLLDSLFYLLRTGCQWRHLPWPTVYGYFRAFLSAGVWDSMRHHLVVVHAAFIQDADDAGHLLGRIKPLYRWLRTVFADGGYNRGAALLACFLLGLTLVIVQRVPGTKGFVVLSRRWVVKRTFGWLDRWRRLSKDYERLPEVSEATVTLAMIYLMLQRLAHPNRKRLPAS